MTSSMSQNIGDVVTILDNLGFEFSETVEAIVSTQNTTGTLNAAPMGIVRTGRDTLEIRPFLETTTFRNLGATGKATINLVHNIMLYLETAFDRLTPGHQLFEKTSTSWPASLREADAFLVVSVLRQGQYTQERSFFVCQAKGAQVNNPFPRAYSRGFAASLEAIIHATRIQAFIGEGEKQKVRELLQSYEQCQQTVEKISEEASPNMKVIRILRDMIEEWLRQPK